MRRLARCCFNTRTVLSLLLRGNVRLWVRKAGGR